MSASTGTTAFLLLGSNLGNRALELRRAVFALSEMDGVTIARLGPIAETLPWGREDVPNYLNAVVQIQCRLTPQELLEKCRAVEARQGRQRSGEKYSPRLLDIDLLLFGRRVAHEPGLTLPHKRLGERPFALKLLTDLAPELVDPDTGQSYIDRLLEQGGTDPKDCQPRGPLCLKPSDVWDDILKDQMKNPTGLLVESESPEETEGLARILGRLCQGGEVMALAGELGAGKTCFARGLARGLDIREPITSPSYVLVKAYEGRLHFCHADFYRLENPGESGPGGNLPEESPDLASLGLDDYLDSPDTVILAEWVNRRPDWLEPPFWLIRLSGSGDQPRTILFEYHPK